jgi:sec-independent protein translocase protein TatC
VLSLLLTQLGLLKVEWMRKFRKIAIVVIFLVAALITPPDIVSQVMVALPMLVLYEFSTILCTVCEKFKKKKQDEEADDEEETEE